MTLGSAHTSLPEAIYQSVRTAVLTGAIRPGEMLRQDGLARQHGVSKIAVREALQRLEGEGLVVLNPRRGYMVVALDPDEIVEIFELRMFVEERAAYAATLKRTEEDVAKLRGLLLRLDAIRMSGPQDILQWSDLNFQFHETLFAASGRRHLRRVASSLRAAVEPYIRVEVYITGEPDEAQGEHHLIVDAFTKGDAARVAMLSRDHCEHTARRLIAGLNRKGHALALKPIPTSTFVSKDKADPSMKVIEVDG
jgi:DNA-binding GntR family transcriptional regulator